MNVSYQSVTASPPIKEFKTAPPTETTSVLSSPRLGEMLKREASDEREKRKQDALERLGRVAAFD